MDKFKVILENRDLINGSNIPRGTPIKVIGLEPVDESKYDNIIKKNKDKNKNN